MKKTLLFLVFMMILAGFQTSGAQTNSTSTSPEGREKIREERKIKIQEKKRQIIENLTQKITEKLNISVARLEEFSVKISEKISRAETNNIDVTEAKKMLEEAKVKIELAKNSILETEIRVEELLVSENINKELIRQEFLKVKNNIESARASLVATVLTLKNAVNQAIQVQLNK